MWLHQYDQGGIKPEKLTMTTAATAVTKDITPGKMEFGIYGTNVDHITCTQIYKTIKRIFHEYLEYINVFNPTTAKMNT
jgi:hypothetical protein